MPSPVAPELPKLNAYLAELGGVQRYITHRQYTISRVRRTPAKQRTNNEAYQIWAEFKDGSRLPDWYPASAFTIAGIADDVVEKLAAIATA